MGPNFEELALHPWLTEGLSINAKEVSEELARQLGLSVGTIIRTALVQGLRRMRARKRDYYYQRAKGRRANE